MPYSVVTTTNARRDIQQAIDWEEERSTGLGKRFFTDLNQRLGDIAAVPKLGSVRYQNIRCTHAETFPYLIHYFVDDDKQTIYILRVLSFKRKPIWK